MLAHQIEGFRQELNFRDLGGYRTGDGREIRRGLLLRGAAPGDMTEEEQERLCHMGIRTIVDFRSQGEREENPDPPFPDIANVHLCAMTGADGREIDYSPSMLFRTALRFKGRNKIRALMEYCYEIIPFSNKAYQKMFRLLLEEQTPVLLHCTAGKDRTGVAAILILLALDVAEETILDDYMLTNEYRRSLLEGVYDSHRLLDRMSTNAHAFFTIQQGVIRSGAESMLEAIYRRYPDTDTFLEEEYGIGPLEKKHLKELYTVERR